MCELGTAGRKAAKRLLASMLVAAASLLLVGCSPEDAQAAKVAAAALKSQIDVALNAFADLIIRGNLEPPPAPEDVVKGIVGQALKDAAPNPGAWKPDPARLQRELAGRSAADAARKLFRNETGDITKAVGDIDAAAADYEAAWPFGSEQFVCLKSGVFRLTKSLREVARSFDADAKPSRRFQELFIEKQISLDKYEAAIRKGDGVSAAATLQGYRDILGAEAKANADVQAAFVRAAQSSADLYTAIESVENVSLADVLRIIQRYAPGLSKLDESIDGEAIAKRAGVVLGKVGQNPWLDRFANQPIPSVGVKCKQSQS